MGADILPYRLSLKGSYTGVEEGADIGIALVGLDERSKCDDLSEITTVLCRWFVHVPVQGYHSVRCAHSLR